MTQTEEPPGNPGRFTPKQMISSLGETTSILWGIFVVLALWFWRYRTLAGLHHIGVGFDRNATRIAGVDTHRIERRAFLLSGILVGVSAVFFLFGAQIGGWDAHTGLEKTLPAIAAAVVGGCRISGGRFDPVSIVLATTFLVATRDVITAQGVDPEFELFFYGLCLLTFGVVDRTSARRSH